jgi:peptidoglycan/xylan/chitin deacetylase (PgdA/CDA1 family)
MKLKNNQIVDIPILSFHQVGRAKESAPPSIYIDVQNFEARLRWMKGWRYHFISLSEAVEMMQGHRAYEPKSAVITFDDGYDGVYAEAFPVLKKYACKATVFLIADTLEKPQITSFPCLSIPHIREMSDYGIEIGSHSMTHADLTKVPAAGLQNEINGSQKKIEALCGIKPRHFCYPYGKYNAGVEKAVLEAGYKSACSTVFGRKHRSGELFKLKRISVPNKQNWLQFFYRMEMAGRR